MPNNADTIEPADIPRRWVDRPEQLPAVIAAIDQAGLIALDTEFIRERTYFPKLALLQLCTDIHDDVYLIDPLAVDLTKFWRHLGQTQATLAIHAGEQDLALIDQENANLPERLFDTQIAAELLGIALQPSYRQLVTEHVGIELNKEESRSDWLARPLTQSQTDYAAADAYYLRNIAQHFQQDLIEQHKQTFMAEEMQAMRAKLQQQSPRGTLWKKVKGHQTLNARERGMLAVLADWRDDNARTTDRPRRWVCSDQQLTDCARIAARTAADAASMTQTVAGLKPLKDEQPALVEALLAIHAQDKTELPASAVPPPLSKPEKELLKSWTQTAQTIAHQQAIVPARLANRSDLRRYLRSDGQHGRISQGWRACLLEGKLNKNHVTETTLQTSSD